MGGGTVRSRTGVPVRARGREHARALVRLRLHRDRAQARPRGEARARGRDRRGVRHRRAGDGRDGGRSHDDAVQRVRQLRRVGEARRGGEGERADQGVAHVRRQVGGALRQAAHGVGHLLRHPRRVRGRERARAREQVVAHGGQAEDVGRGRQPVLAAHLLRRGVRGGERRAAILRQVRHRPLLARHLRDAEVQHAHVGLVRVVARLQEQVARLDVAVHQAHAVPGRQPARRLAQDGQRHVRGRRPRARQAHGQVLALQQLHHQEVQPHLGIRPEVVDGHHVGMVQRRRGPRLAQKAALQAGVVVLVMGHDADDLYGHGAAQALVAGAIHGAHAAASDHRVDAIAPAEGAPGQQARDPVHLGWSMAFGWIDGDAIAQAGLTTGAADWFPLPDELQAGSGRDLRIAGDQRITQFHRRGCDEPVTALGDHQEIFGSLDDVPG